MSAAEDQADVDRVLTGNLEAFEGIVRRWQGPLINLAYRFCRDRGRAEEMAQEAFLRAFNALGQWRREAMFSTWLFSLATRLYCKQLRRIPISPYRWTTSRNHGTQNEPTPALRKKRPRVLCAARSMLSLQNIANRCYSIILTSSTSPQRPRIWECQRAP